MHSFPYGRKCYYKSVVIIWKFEYQKVLENLGYCTSKCIFVYSNFNVICSSSGETFQYECIEDLIVWMLKLYYSTGAKFKHWAIPLIIKILVFEKIIIFKDLKNLTYLAFEVDFNKNIIWIYFSLGICCPPLKCQS